MLEWFGAPAGAGYETQCPHVATPVGQPCDWCDELFTEKDDGFIMPLLGQKGRSKAPYHYECHMRQVVGGLNHLRGNCTCCGGSEPPDPSWLTRRQAARQALSVWERRARQADAGG